MLHEELCYTRKWIAYDNRQTYTTIPTFKTRRNNFFTNHEILILPCTLWCVQTSEKIMPNVVVVWMFASIDLPAIFSNQAVAAFNKWFACLFIYSFLFLFLGAHFLFRSPSLKHSHKWHRYLDVQSHYTEDYVSYNMISANTKVNFQNFNHDLTINLSHLVVHPQPQRITFWLEPFRAKRLKNIESRKNRRRNVRRVDDRLANIESIFQFVSAVRIVSAGRVWSVNTKMCQSIKNKK